MLADARVHPRGGEELRRGGDSDARDTQVTADDFAVGRDKRRIQVHHDMQVEALLPHVVAQIRRADPPCQIFTIAGGQGERHQDAATDGGKRGRATCELDPIRAGIVADGAAFRLRTGDALLLLVAFFDGLEGFGGFGARRHHELGRQGGVFCPESAVGGVMQAVDKRIVSWRMAVVAGSVWSLRRRVAFIVGILPDNPIKRNGTWLHFAETSFTERRAGEGDALRLESRRLNRKRIPPLPEGEGSPALIIYEPLWDDFLEAMQKVRCRMNEHEKITE